MNLFKECPGLKRIRTPFPEEIKCSCGNIVEIWSDEVRAICKNCKREVIKELFPTCLDWCSMARKCLGEDRYKKYLASKKKEA